MHATRQRRARCANPRRPPHVPGFLPTVAARASRTADFARGETRPESPSSSASPRTRESVDRRSVRALAMNNPEGENAPLLRAPPRRPSYAAPSSARNGVAATLVAGCVVAALAFSGRFGIELARVERASTAVSRPREASMGVAPREPSEGELGNFFTDAWDSTVGELVPGMTFAETAPAPAPEGPLDADAGGPSFDAEAPGSNAYPGVEGCEATCESDDVTTEEDCNAIGPFCEWGEGKCWSAVGPAPCPEDWGEAEEAEAPGPAADADADADAPSEPEKTTNTTKKTKNAKSEEDDDDLSADADAPAPSNDDADAPEPSDDAADAPEPSDDDADAPEPSDDDADAPEPSDDDADAPEPSDDDADAPEPSDDDADAPAPAPEVDLLGELETVYGEETEDPEEKREFFDKLDDDLNDTRRRTEDIEDSLTEAQRLERIEKAIQRDPETDEKSRKTSAKEKSRADAHPTGSITPLKIPALFEAEVYRGDIAEGVSDDVLEQIVRRKMDDNAYEGLFEDLEVKRFEFRVHFDVTVKGSKCPRVSDRAFAEGVESFVKKARADDAIARFGEDERTPLQKVTERNSKPAHAPEMHDDLDDALHSMTIGACEDVSAEHDEKEAKHATETSKTERESSSVSTHKFRVDLVIPRAGPETNASEMTDRVGRLFDNAHVKKQLEAAHVDKAREDATDVSIGNVTIHGQISVAEKSKS